MIEIFQNKSKTFQKSNQLLHLLYHHCFLIVKDQFGAVGPMEMVNWDWETQHTETKQKRFKDFLQSNQWQEEITMHCFLIVKDLSGAVGTMDMVDWDWETQHKETKQKKFKDFLQSNQWQEECISQCLCLWIESERRIGAGPHNTNQFASEKQQSFWNCCCCRRVLLFFNVSGQTRKCFHLWVQSVWAAGIGRHFRQTHTAESQQHPSNVFSFFLQHSGILFADCGL